jgi:hypothetical protein
MNNDTLLDQDLLFQTYFKDGLKIRAICDDLNYPAEYSPVFVNIHIRGAEHFRKPALTEEQLKQVFYYLSPEAQQQLRDSRLEKETDLKKELSHVFIGGELERADQYLAEHTGVSRFFRNQLENTEKLYFDTAYREKMIELYEKTVKPLLTQYDDLKVEATFAKVRQSKN